MNRRKFLLGTVGVGAIAAGGALLARPKDEGAPYDDYFRTLNDELKRNGPMRPCMVIDLDRLDHNIDKVAASVKAPKHYRVVEKSLPSVRLLDYVCKRAGTKRLMSFHQPFLSVDAEVFPDSDILIGKPLPVRSAELFYKNLKGSFDPARQLQWLIDAPGHLSQYLELAKGLGTRLRINLEIDVGLHRGGVADHAGLEQLLSTIEANPEHLEFSGFMGYDPHLVKLPKVFGTPEELLRKSMASYQGFVDYARSHHPRLWREDPSTPLRTGLTLNAAGSPTYKLHEAETLSNDISVGSGLIKPTDFDVFTLAEHQPACFIATPVLKAGTELRLPGLEEKSRALSWWDPNRRRVYFIYGGNWMAHYESPHGLRRNELYGYSSNQEMANGSSATGLNVDDHVFLRPTQSEFVLLQFGDLVTVRGGRIQDSWPVFAG
jgi:D-serine deaminase-like pyridoxal phosphate-dependent protein